MCLHKELIDTCWDVNTVSSNIIQMTEAELIDTCWDVNIVVSSQSGRLRRINRYMLGCK